ncbi:MAG: SAVED domain-containing protein [Pseudomonadaceae bacterium]|nr:SAVED domain-containing protein [Pseudomonadaceae bacterium]
MSDWMALWHKIVDWYTRPKTLAFKLISTGVALIGVSALGDLAGDLLLKTNEVELHVRGSTSGGLPNAWLYTIGGLGLLVLLIGLVLAWQDRKQIQRKRAIVMEHRGLFSIDTPLASSLPATIVGKREELIVDVREGIEDGKLTRPEVALQKIVESRGDLKRRLERENLEDVVLVYGGLNAVPLTFIAGLLLDDESHIRVFDWDRAPPGRWKEIAKGGDDQKRFEVDQRAEGTHGEAILALSVSYLVELPAIRETFGNLPLTHLKMQERSSDAHWSSEKQAALAMQFFEELKRLAACGFSRIHLVIAAPNSVVFQMGRIFDRRNLPAAIIHQFERTASPAYPWGIELPSHGVSEPTVLHRKQATAAADYQV